MQSPTIGLSKEDIEALCKPFGNETLGVKVQSLSKGKDKALLVLYLQHTDVAARLDAVDPSWSFHIKQTDNRAPNEVFVSGTLSIKGVVRENYGEGQELKGATSDCLKRCAMLFGVGRNLYDSELVWVPYNEQTDKYKVWTIQEYLSKAKKTKIAPNFSSDGLGTSTTKAASANLVGAPSPVKQMEDKYPKATQYFEGPPLGMFDESIPEDIGGPTSPKSESPLANYKIDIGAKYRGLTLGEIDEPKLKSYIEYVENGEVHKSERHIEFLEKAKQYLEDIK